MRARRPSAAAREGGLFRTGSRPDRSSALPGAVPVGRCRPCRAVPSAGPLVPVRRGRPGGPEAGRNRRRREDPDRCRSRFYSGTYTTFGLPVTGCGVMRVWTP
ncbi:hypothetical protein Sdia_13500 [Streptomyces diastaticus subsp. diastaticus]|uniref:Uncharacterized protein n=1 Tax=Streptomyces diastaticus subsp. diastaticus TaxID=68040 RepID=A0ABQ1CJL1_STRDI|nr:hypothetical protein Sdia_13500 [Streptomyces diastaticus subsp. diastaticus]GGU34818.1 hypothetical protein GCM10015534_41680 [Streptomyces diastaticus subsp. diastaticus]